MISKKQQDHCLKYLKPFTKRLIIGPIFKLIEAIFELIVPILMALIIDEGIKARGGDIKYIITIGLIIIGLGILGLVSSLVCQFNASRASQGYGTVLRNTIFRKINSLSNEELEKVGSSTLINIMTNDINQLQVAVAMLIRLVIRAPFLVIGSLVAAMIINFKIGLIFLVTIIIIAVILFIIIKSSSKRYPKVQQKLDDLSVVTSENLKGAREVRGFAMEHVEKARFNKEVKTYQKEALLIAKISSLLNPLTTIATNSAIILVLYFGGQMVNNGNLLQGEVIALVNYLNQMLLALIVVSNLVVIFTKAYASLKRCNALLALNSHLVEGSLDKISNDDNMSLLIFNNVSFHYLASNQNALSNCHFQIKKGETIGIIGSTGSGKSTIVKLIERFYDPTEGEIILAGHNMKEYKFSTIRKNVGLVHQKAVLFKGTIRSNLLMSNPDATDEEMIDALKKACAYDFLKEKGMLDAICEENGRNFSGGQRQRLTIATVLVKKPMLLILDDATSALDYLTDAKVRANIKELENDLTTIIISQRASSIKDANQIIVLDEGKIEAMGPHEELLKISKVYQEICSSQNEGGKIDA